MSGIKTILSSIVMTLLLLSSAAIHSAEPLKTAPAKAEVAKNKLENPAKQNQDLLELQSLLAKFDYFSANFEQKLINKKGKELQHLTGQLKLKKPNLLNWQAQEPYPQQVVADGKKVWLYDADLEQVTVKPMTDDMSQAPALILAGKFEAIAKQYHVRKLAKGHFNLLPKQDNPLFQALELKFKGVELEQLLIIDKLGQITQVKLTNYDARTKIPAKVFQFVVPEGSDVLHDA